MTCPTLQPSYQDTVLVNTVSYAVGPVSLTVKLSGSLTPSEDSPKVPYYLIFISFKDAPLRATAMIKF